jgi:hypothetical protein
MEAYLRPTRVIDCDAEPVRAKVEELVGGTQSKRDGAVSLYYFVRDHIRFDPFAPGLELEDHRASATLQRGTGYCQHKAILLVALARAAGIPARLGFADIRDHRMPARLRQIIGGDNTLVYHGYAHFHLDGEWVRACPTFDLDTCKKNGFVPVDFDGTTDAMDAGCDLEGRPHIEYILDRGPYDDFPWNELCKVREEIAARLGLPLAELKSQWWDDTGV